MKSIYRLKKNYQYNYVYKHAESVADRYFVLLYCKSNRTVPQAGFSISKKYGHAVNRNRIRRQMKAVTAKIMPNVKNGYNVVIIPRKTDIAFAKITESINALFEKAGLLQ